MSIARPWFTYRAYRRRIAKDFKLNWRSLERQTTKDGNILVIVPVRPVPLD
jgi:hypothetical protein